MRIALAAALILGCSDPVTPSEDAATDAPSVDTGIDAEVCGAITPLPREPSGNLPMGAWNGGWACVDGCALPRPALTEATRVELGVGANSYAEWRNGPPIARTPIHADSECWVADPSPGECRSAIEICASAAGVAVHGAAWVIGGETQHWSFSGTR